MTLNTSRTDLRGAGYLSFVTSCRAFMTCSAGILSMKTVFSLDLCPDTRLNLPPETPRSLESRFSSSVLAFPSRAGEVRLTRRLSSSKPDTNTLLFDRGRAMTLRNAPFSFSQTACRGMKLSIQTPIRVCFTCFRRPSRIPFYGNTVPSLPETVLNNGVNQT